jgi:anaphase-promoting complex subunit 2
LPAWSINVCLAHPPPAEIWTVNDLAARVGMIERSTALKALFAWVDRGVLREETDSVDEQCFRLLELVPEDSGAASMGMTAAGSRPVLTEEEPAMLTVQQQQAEQMKVFWKVRHLCCAGTRTHYN